MKAILLLCLVVACAVIEITSETPKVNMEEWTEKLQKFMNGKGPFPGSPFFDLEGGFSKSYSVGLDLPGHKPGHKPSLGVEGGFSKSYSVGLDLPGKPRKPSPPCPCDSPSSPSSVPCRTDPPSSPGEHPQTTSTTTRTKEPSPKPVPTSTQSSWTDYSTATTY